MSPIACARRLVFGSECELVNVFCEIEIPKPKPKARGKKLDGKQSAKRVAGAPESKRDDREERKKPQSTGTRHSDSDRRDA